MKIPVKFQTTNYGSNFTAFYLYPKTGSKSQGSVLKKKRKNPKVSPYENLRGKEWVEGREKAQEFLPKALTTPCGIKVDIPNTENKIS